MESCEDCDVEWCKRIIENAPTVLEATDRDSKKKYSSGYPYPSETATSYSKTIEASDYECPHYKGVCGLDESIVCFSKSNRNCDIRLGASGKASFDCSAPNCLDCERNDECNYIGLFERQADDRKT